MRRLSLALVLLVACSALCCSKKKNTVTPPTTGTLQGIAQTAVGDTVLAGVRVSTSPATSSVSTDATGRYTIPDVTGGQYAVTGTKSGYTPYTVSVSVIAGQTTNADLTMARVAPTTGIIRGQVRTATGDTLVVGASIVTTPPTSSILTDTQGRYEIRDVSPGQYIVTATKGGYQPGSINVSVLAGSTTTADILLTRTGPTEGSIQGQVRTSLGDSLIVGARVETAPATSSVTTDQQGRYAILHVTPGQYAVTAGKTGYNPGHTEVSVVAGQATTADIRLTRVLVNTPPYEPVLLLPTNGTTGQSVTPTLRWSGDDPDGDPLSYDVYCDTLVSPLLRVAESLTDSTYNLARLRGDKTYYWRILAHDGRGGSTPSQVSQFTTRPDTLPTDGLIAYYPFNGNAHDESGNGNNGTVSNATLTSDRHGIDNQAYSFNGVSSYIEVSDTPLLRISNTDFTISLWSEQFTYNTQQSTLLSKRSSSGDDNSGYHYTIQGPYYDSGRLQFQVSGGLDPRANSISAIALRTWTHTLLTYSNATRVLTIYINGVVDSITPDLRSPSASAVAKLYIGWDPGVGATYCFNGQIDDIRMYGRVLTADEIQQLYGE